MFSEYDIAPEFADVVASFGQEPNIAEGSSNNATIHTNGSSSSALSYQIRYVEQNSRSGQNSWSRRHTGVYHDHKDGAGLDVVIMLHPIRDPAFEHAIATLQDDMTERVEICNNPLRLHEILFGCYMDKWRWYLRYLGEQFSKANDFAMVIKPEGSEPNSSFLRIQELRNTNDLVLLARAGCAGNLDLLERICELYHRTGESTDALETLRWKMRGFTESAEVLKSRIQNSIDLVGFTLMLHNQLESAKVEKRIHDLTESLNNLTQDTVDDSATVKVITFVSAVYLPGRFGRLCLA